MWWINRNRVAVKHEPTGITASCDSDRSQHKNRLKAMEQLRARIWAATNLKRPEDSSEKTYVFPGEVTHPNDITEYMEEENDTLSTKPVLHE